MQKTRAAIKWALILERDFAFRPRMRKLNPQVAGHDFMNITADITAVRFLVMQLVAVIKIQI